MLHVNVLTNCLFLLSPGIRSCHDLFTEHVIRHKEYKMSCYCQYVKVKVINPNLLRSFLIVSSIILYVICIAVCVVFVHHRLMDLI